MKPQTQATHFKVTSQVDLDISIDGEPIGYITIGLFGHDAPKTVANFREICINGIDGRTYAGTRFHRVIDRFIIQGSALFQRNIFFGFDEQKQNPGDTCLFVGGDILHGDGRGSVSIYGKYFEDENLTINHTAPGFIGMANSGPDRNGCQFYITTMASPWLNGVHTIFGKVVQGAAYVHVIEKVCVLKSYLLAMAKESENIHLKAFAFLHCARLKTKTMVSGYD